MRINKLISLEIIIILIGLVLAMLWTQNPSGNYELYILALTLILVVVDIYRRISTNSHKSYSDLNPAFTGISSITANQIIETIKSAPPFQNDKCSNNYEGTKVNWIGYLKAARQDYSDSNNVRVILNIKKNDIGGNSIWFTVNVTKFPDIRKLKEKSKIRVMGEVISVSRENLCVEVKPIEIEVLKN